MRSSNVRNVGMCSSNLQVRYIHTYSFKISSFRVQLDEGIRTVHSSWDFGLGAEPEHV